VSTRKQVPHLERQIEELRRLHPEARVFRDVCSGIDFQRPGLRSLLDRAFAGQLRTVYVAHRDRLCRFACDLLVDVLRRCGVRVHVESHDPHATPEGELADDLLSIVTVFGARLYGSRSRGGGRRKRRREASEADDDNATGAGGGGVAGDPIPETAASHGGGLPVV
jgi:predicted site-specific integrase-resolvase